MRFLTMGEVMIQLNPVISGPLRHVNLFEKHVAGSEGNVAIGLSRLGENAGIITAIGEDEFGKNVISVLRGEGVDVSHVFIDPHHPTGVYFIQRDFPFQGAIDVLYYRSSSAMANFSPSLVDEVDLGEVDVFHTSGITLMLSENCEKATKKMMERILNKKIFFSFDTNIRKKLIGDEKRAIDTLKPFIQSANLIFTGSGDLKFLLNRSDEDVEKLLDEFMRFFSISEKSVIVVKMGSNGALVKHKGKTHHRGAFRVRSLDTVGAGDAFDAAFLAFFLESGDISSALERASLVGALVTTMRGDFEAFPDREEIEIALRYSEGDDLR